MSVAGALPCLLFVADGFASGRPDLDARAVQDRAVALVAAGVPWVMLRDHRAPEAIFASAAAALADRLRQRHPGVLLRVNGRPETARTLAAGLHLRGAQWDRMADDLSPLGDDSSPLGFGPLPLGDSPSPLGDGLLSLEAFYSPLGVSVHSVAESERAGRVGADYALFSPVWPTATHPDALPAGPGRLSLAARRSGIPVLALGGLTPTRARQARQAGAHGVAVLSDLLYAPDPEAAVAAYLQALA